MHSHANSRKPQIWPVSLSQSGAKKENKKTVTKSNQFWRRSGYINMPFILCILKKIPRDLKFDQLPWFISVMPVSGQRSAGRLWYNCLVFFCLKGHNVLIGFGRMSQDLSGDESILLQVRAWCHEATSHYLNHVDQILWRHMAPAGLNKSISRTKLAII